MSWVLGSGNCFIDKRPPITPHCCQPMLNGNFGFTPAEVRQIRALKMPHGIQRFLDGLDYHLADTAWSPRRVLHGRTAHCLEGAIFAAAALRILGYPPLVIDLEAERDTDHVVALYRMGGAWGAIAKSNYSGCRGRQPIYRNLRELALSYFEGYFNLRRQLSLRAFSRPVNLGRFDHLNWMATDKPVWFIPFYLFEIHHYPLLKPGMSKRLARLDERSFQAGLVGRKSK